jgi:hypothetical protein
LRLRRLTILAGSTPDGKDLSKWSFVDPVLPNDISQRLSTVAEDSIGLHDDFLFVNVNPSSTHNESTTSRKSIRGQVMRNFQQKTKFKAQSSEDGLQFETANTNSKQISSLQDSNIVDSGSGQPPKSTTFKRSKFRNLLPHSSESQNTVKSKSKSDQPIQWIVTESLAEIEDTRTTVYKSYKATLSVISKSPLTPMGAGSLDPFNTYPGTNNGPYVAEILDNCEFYPIAMHPFILYARQLKLLEISSDKLHFPCACATPCFRKHQSLNVNTDPLRH